MTAAAQIDNQQTADQIAAEAMAVCIARDNDTFRKAIAVFGGKSPINLSGQMVHTQGVAALDVMDQLTLFKAVRTFSGFSDENDPNGEHDFGAIDHGDVRYFWKIDCYADERCTHGSEDPSDTTQTYRVLTVMCASEY